jgi:hypothetical protein
MSIQIITDCNGLKQGAIRGVLMEAFKKQPVSVKVIKEKDFTTPLTKEDFLLIAEKRIQYLAKNDLLLNERGCIPPWVFATIIKGYYRVNGNWYLCCCAGFATTQQSPILVNLGSSVPVPRVVSEKKNQDLERNMSDILAELNPGWNKDSVFNLLTKEDEMLWLQQPLRYIVKSI